MNVSLDGYIEDTDGSIELSTPDDEVHRLANEQAQRDVSVSVRTTPL